MSTSSNTPSPGLLTLAIDIGGTGIKSTVLDPAGKPTTERVRLKTPSPATPAAVMDIIDQLVSRAGKFDRVSVGFPGVIHHGTVYTAHNLDPGWVGFALQEKLQDKLNKPVRVANDAAVQGFGAITDKGVELVITLGTGLGSSLYLNGRVCPLELAHHPAWGHKTYEEKLGVKAFEKVGVKRWSKRVMRAIAQLEHVFNYDHLYIGGGNAPKIIGTLPANASIVSNEDGLYGGIALWREGEQDQLRPAQEDTDTPRRVPTAAEPPS